MTAKSKRWLFSAVMLIYLAVVAWLCFGNFSNVPSISESFLGLPMDKVVHFCMFLPFPIIGRGLFIGKTKKPMHSLILVLLLFLAGCLLAAGTELGQGLTDYRSADSADFFADGVGLGIGSIIALILDLRAAFRKTTK